MSEETKRDDGGQAFPTTHDGMTLRDWFAGMAMQGFIASGANGTARDAMACYEAADHMLVARRAQ